MNNKLKILIGVVGILGIIGIFILLKPLFIKENKTRFLSSGNSYLLNICDKENICDNFARGTEVKLGKKVDDATVEIKLNEKIYLVKNEVLVMTKEEVVLEKIMFVRTPTIVYENIDSTTIIDNLKKGVSVEIIGYENLLNDGTTKYYKIKYNEKIGYIFSKYMVFDEISAKANYDEEGTYQTHLARVDRYGGGSAGNLDYYPEEKVVFENNKMPEEVRSLYLNGTSGVIKGVDSYIEYAKSVNINAFVVDIRDSGVPAYQSEVYKKYSMSNYNYANNTMDEYKTAINKLKEAGFYLIGRISAFKDEYHAVDNPDLSIADNEAKPMLLHRTYWPSPYQRKVWEYNIELALEAAAMGFNEIQFDYVRFPDQTRKYERAGTINFKNEYDEEKAEAVQGFLRYAKDVLHAKEIYISADVFGESAHTYVTSYGQYWAAISNVVDVISGMPYPDHFSLNEYGFTTPPYKVPYEILNYWGKNFVQKRQAEIKTPAVVRTWIQAYNSLPGDFPYNNKQIEDQIQGLYDAGLTGGFMTWNSNSSIEKYKSFADAFKKEYK